MKSIKDTFMFNFLNSNNDLENRLIKIVQEAEYYNFEQEEMIDVFRTMSKYKYSTKDEIFKMVKNNKIRIMYMDNSVYKLPMPLLFFTLRIGGENVAFVNMSNICSGRAETVEPRKLYAILEGAFLQLRMMEKSNIMTYRLSGFVKAPITCYVKLFTNILNIDHSISVDPIIKGQIEFVVAKFCLLNIMEFRDIDIDKINNIALSCTSVPISYNLVEPKDVKFSAGDYLDVQKFFNALTDSKIFPILKNYNIRTFLTSWTKSYNSASLFSIEYLPYLVFMITSVLRSSNIIDQYKVESQIANYERELEEFVLYLMK